MKCITLTQLTYLDTCAPAVEAFRRVCGESLDLTKPVTADVVAALSPYVGWAAENLLNWRALTDYYSKRELLRADYYSKYALLRTDYYSKHAALRADYYNKRDLLRTDYYSKHTALRVDYYSKHTALRTDYYNKRVPLFIAIALGDEE